MNKTKELIDFFRRYTSEKISSEEFMAMNEQLSEEEKELVQVVVQDFRTCTRAGAEMVFTMLDKISRTPEDQREDAIIEMVHLCIAADCRPQIVFSALDQLGYKIDKGKILASLFSGFLQALDGKNADGSDDDPLSSLISKFHNN